MHMAADEHLLAVASFMQANVPQSKILAVADALPQLAGLLWSSDVAPEERPLRLVPTFTPADQPGDGRHTPSDAIG